MSTQFLASARLPVHWESASNGGGLPSHNLPRLIVLILALVLATVPAFCGSARAQAPQGEEVRQPAPVGPLEIGKLLYQYNCGSCHGKTLKGDGPVAKVLKTRPSNLTLLAKHSGGKFPRAEVYGYVVGTEAVAAHGTRQMPVWGPGLSEEPDGPYGLTQGRLTRPEARQRVNEILDYIATKQVK